MATHYPALKPGVPTVDAVWLDAFVKDAEAARNGQSLTGMQRGVEFSPPRARFPNQSRGLCWPATPAPGHAMWLAPCCPAGWTNFGPPLGESSSASGFAGFPVNTHFMSRTKNIGYFRSPASKLHEVVSASTYLGTPGAVTVQFQPRSRGRSLAVAITSGNHKFFGPKTSAAPAP